ncbi:Uncharacterised protein [Burkholderia pseudomallei]|uniref:hypothetical protein n=1 Tax=Burkholderia pseudomallei TaxID=28450 RepID=UPI000F07599C|nr:hypothetical protein [Burkholderia pseudomallei]CAJ7238107.1 Uncharacterised protein [Burkholderia pseudomallei]VBC15441.1 Uncharacterised protein [Burkholderia pseudomallei]VBS98747.1 Uncharacterised protein [Burkholderia pseudomallei]
MIANRRQTDTALPRKISLRAADAHSMLRNPDEFADAFRDVDCATATRLVEQLTPYLRTTTRVDGIGVIDQLTFVCTDDRPGQSSMRSLSRAVAEFVANCMQFVADDDAEIIIEFVMWVPLIYGFDLLCKVGTAYGLVRGPPDSELASAERYIADINAIEHAIEIWRERARRAIASGYVMEEGDLFLFLDGLAHLGVGATDADALAALGEFCSEVPGGFAYLLKRACESHGAA